MNPINLDVAMASENFDLGEIDMNYKLVIGTILIGLAVVFTIQNVTVTDLRF